MNIDLVELWHALESLPILFSITVYALVILTVAAFFVVPLLVALHSEPRQTFRSVRALFEESAGFSSWRRTLYAIAQCMTSVNTVVGRATAWLVLYMTLMQFVVVVMRYVFSYGSIQMQESIWYMHGLLFMLGAGYTLAMEGHVRLDVFYREASKRTKAWINLIGSLVLLLPFCLVVFDFAWPLVLKSWAVYEGSTEAAGLPYVYLFKSVILVFAMLLAMQGIALATRSILTLTDHDEPKVTAEQ